VPKRLSQRDQTADALKRLKISPEQVAKVPQITPIFKKAEGGLKGVLDAMRFCREDETIAQFLRKYDSISGVDRERLPWEAIAIKAKIDIQQLTGAIMFALQASSANIVRMLAWSAHPAVMQKTIDYAKLPSGEKDRSMLHTGLGWLPSAKGPTFIGKQVAVFGGRESTENNPAAPVSTFDGDDDLDQLFPSSSDMQQKLVPIRQRLLESPR
jgi:hypothetical protein